MTFKEENFLIVMDLMSQAFHENAIKHGFWPFSKAHEDSCTVAIHPISKEQIDVNLRNKGEMIALIHSELSECLEGIRKPGADQHCPEFSSEEIELADAMIRIMEYGTAFKLRLAEAIIAKHEFNKSRSFKHGKAF